MLSANRSLRICRTSVNGGHVGILLYVRIDTHSRWSISQEVLVVLIDYPREPDPGPGSEVHPLNLRLLEPCSVQARAGG
jgi:hypothetical protein